MWPKPHETADLVKFTEESLIEKFIFCVVKLGFVDWFFHNLVIVMKYKCKILNKNSGKALLFSRIRYFVGKIENFDELQLP